MPWLISLISISAALLTVLVPHFRSSREIDSLFPSADGVFTRAETVNLSPNLDLQLRYSPLADMGVELQLWREGYRKWTAHVAPLGTAHSSYTHFVECVLQEDKVRVFSRGSSGQIVETFSLLTGKRLSREVTLNRSKQNPPKEALKQNDFNNRLKRGGFEN